MSQDFEKILKERLSYKQSENFDKDFWQKFEGIKKKKTFNFFSVFVPSLVACLLIIFIGSQSQISPIKTESFNAEVVEMAPLLEELEVLAELDDEDWEVLLGEGS